MQLRVGNLSTLGDANRSQARMASNEWLLATNIREEADSEPVVFEIASFGTPRLT